MEKGYLAIVLHAHLPFVRHPEYEESIEENWLFEAITEVYIPLLLTLDSLIEEGVDYRLTFSLTPPLASMLLDPFLQSRYLGRIGRLIELAEKEMERTKSQQQYHPLARMYHERFLRARTSFVERYQKNLVEAFKKLQDLGKIEIIASAATHGYLPLLSVNPSAVRAQIRVGVEHYQAVFGRKPRGFWLPECGYYPGVDELLAEQGIRFTILETHGITHADPRPKYGVHAPLVCPSGVAVFGRDPESSKQVWSSVEGYPGDFDYREFYRDIAYDLPLEYLKPQMHHGGIRTDTGIKYYRVTGKTNEKQLYVPAWAERKAEMHAGNFMFNREKQIEFLASVMGRKPIVVAPYDAELFGHWWYEGPLWLGHLLRKIAREQNTIRLITLSEYLEEYPIDQLAVPAASSWGHQGFSEVWLNGRNDWIYRHLHHAAERLEKAEEQNPRARGLLGRALLQARRELLLAQASDWAFMINSGSMVEYASKREKTHLLRCNRLCDQIDRNEIDQGGLSALEEYDNIFSADILSKASSPPANARPEPRPVSGASTHRTGKSA
jgi:1,4-alpha-glucan branching enzyme